MENEEIKKIFQKFKDFYGVDNIRIRERASAFDWRGELQRFEMLINNQDYLIVELDVKDGNIDISGIEDIEVNKNNISLYYEFIKNDMDNLSYKLFWLESENKSIFMDRCHSITKELGIPFKTAPLYAELINTNFKDIQLFQDKEKTLERHTPYKDLKQMSGLLYFGVRDALKPIDEYIEEIKNSDEYKKYIIEKSTDVLNNKISQVKERKISFYQFDKETKIWEKLDTGQITLDDANSEKWNLGSNEGMVEINSYLLKLDEAINMITPAVDEDGFDLDELYIWKEKEIIKDLDSDDAPLQNILKQYENSFIKDDSPNESKHLVEECSTPTPKLQKQR